MLTPGDSIVIERKTGYRTYGTFVMQDEQGLVIESTVGDSIGEHIMVRWENVDLIRFRVRQCSST